MSATRLRPWTAALHQALLGNTSALAAGVTLFATIQACAAIVAVWGLVADPADIPAQLDGSTACCRAMWSSS